MRSMLWPLHNQIRRLQRPNGTDNEADENKFFSFPTVKSLKSYFVTKFNLLTTILYIYLNKVIILYST